MPKYNGPGTLASASGAGDYIAERQCAPNNTQPGAAPELCRPRRAAVREIIAARRAEDRRRDLLWLEARLDYLTTELSDLGRGLEPDAEPVLEPATVRKWVDHVEKDLRDALAVLADAIDDGAVP